MAEMTQCVRYQNIFLHPLLDDGATPNSRSQRREQAMVRAQAETLCAQCPRLAACLTDAVAKYDVSGFVAGTTGRQRKEIRARLAVEVAPEDFDSAVGLKSGRQYDSQEIHRLRTDHPELPLVVIADRIGCSVSTIKRHLRKMQAEGLAWRGPERPAPTPVEVMAVASEVLRATRRGVAA